jgi:chromosome segregation ATPase
MKDKEGIELELHSFQEKVNQLEGEIASLNMKIVELESSSKGVIEEMTKSKELSSVRESSQSGEEISEESTLKEVNITLKEQVSSLIKENEELQQTISELDEFNEELSKDVSKFCKEVDRLLIVNETLELQLKEANQRQVPAVENNEERKEMLQIIEFKDKQLEEKERAINSKDKEMQEKEKKFNLIRQELEDMEEKVLLEKEEMEMSFIKTVEELKCYKCKVKEFNKRESELTEKLLSMEVQVSSLQAEIKQKEAVINESKNKLEELTVELKEKTQLLENTRKELRDSTNSQQEDELSKPVSLIGVGGGPSLTMQESYDRLEFDHDKLNKQHQRLKDELIKTRNERDRYKKERNTFRVKYYELSGKEPVIEPKTTSSTGSNSSTSTIPPTISDTVPTASIKEESLASVPTPKVLRRSILSFPLPNSMKDVPKENIEEVSQVKTITSSALCDKGKPKLIVSKWDQSMLEMAGEAKKTNNDDHRGSSMLPPPGKLTEKQKNDCKQQ